MSVIVRSRRLVSPAQVRTALLTGAVAVPAMAAAFLADAAPTGIGLVDTAWVVTLVAVVAYMTSTAKRWTWFVPAGAAAAMGGTQWALAASAIAIAISLYSVVTETRSRARGALAGGLGTLALLGAGNVAFHGLSALVTAAAIAAPCVSGYRYAGRRSRARIRKVAGWSGVVCLLAVAGATIALVTTYNDLIEGVRKIDDGLAAAREADDDAASVKLGDAVRHLNDADATLSSWLVGPARLLPILGPNIEAVGSLTHDAADVAQVTSTAAEDADVDSLRFIDGRLDPKAVTNMKRPLAESLLSVQVLADTLDDATHSPWLVSPLTDRVDLMRSEIDEALPDGEAAVEAIDHANYLLGANTPRRFLVLFTTPVEARGRTGFPGNYAELVIDKGKLSMPVFGRVSELELGGVVPGAQRQIAQPPEYLTRYSRFDPQATWRNVPMTPDFPTVALVSQQLYFQSTGRSIDGVLSVDPVGLAALLRYTGAVQVEGMSEPLDADNAAQFLQLDQYVEFTDVSQRIDVLEEVARTTFERLTSADLPSPRALVESFDPVVDGGHIQFAPYETKTFLWLDQVGLTGRFTEFDGDTLAVTTSNAGGNKIDLFLERHVRYDVRWNPGTRQVEGTITLALTNKAPASGLPDYVIGNYIDAPPGTNRSYLSVYTPLSLEAARIDGAPAALEPGAELQRNVYSRFLDIPPGATRLVQLDVKGTIASDDYVLDLFEQPLVRPEQAEVNVEVAGRGPVEAAIDGPVDAEVTMEGRTAHWAGPLDRRTSISLDPGR
jgi:hypothetical protein